MGHLSEWANPFCTAYNTLEWFDPAVNANTHTMVSTVDSKWCELDFATIHSIDQPGVLQDTFAEARCREPGRFADPHEGSWGIYTKI